MKTTQILTIISLSCLFISLVSSFLTKIPVVVKNVFFLVAVVLLATSQVIKYIPEEMSDENFNFGYEWLKRESSTVDLIKDLVIVAHPDDESIWVGEILGPLCTVILVTCENETRFNEFKQIMDKTGVKNWQILNFPDSKDHRGETSLWKIKDLIPKVRKVMKSFPDLENIYTHNANGEYGHPDHKSVHQAVTAAYAQEYNLDDNKPELYVFAPNGVTDKQGYPNSGCTCTESSLRKSLIDIYDEKLKGTQSVQQFRNLCPRVRNISSQIVQDVVDVVIP